MGVGVMTGRCSALPAGHRNMNTPLVCTHQPQGIAQPRSLHPAVTQQVRPKKLRQKIFPFLGNGFGEE